MKKQYTAAEAEILSIGLTDIIRTSGDWDEANQEICVIAKPNWFE